MTRFYRPHYILLTIAAALPLELSARSPSYLGTAGVLRIPSAKVPSLGQFNYQFNTASDIPREFPNTNNHVINIGFANSFELGGRLTDWYVTRARRDNGTRTGFRDLSGNLKWRLPLALDNVDVAVGVLDFAGEAIQLRSPYAVATTDFRNAEFSLGFADGGSVRALDGLFAGARIKLHPNFHALADYSSDSIGFGVDLSRDFGRFSLSALLSVDRTDNGTWNSAAGLSISSPLHQQKRKSAPASIIQPVARKARDLQKLASTLVAEGFTHITISTDDLGDTINFSNQVYNHTDVDALLKVLSIAYLYTGNSPRITSVLKKSNFAVASISAPTAALGEYLNGKITAGRFFGQTEFVGPGEQANPASVTKVKPKFTQAAHTRFVDIRLQPDLRTAVGTEFGVFDYSAALRADVKVPLPSHFSLLASYSVPISHSDLYDNGAVFSGSRHQSQLNHAVVQRFWMINRQVPYLLSVGYQNILQNDYLVVRQEAAHFVRDGHGVFQGKVGYLASQEDNLDDQLIGTVGYTHFWSGKSFGASAETGQFLGEDQGTKFELFRFFGNAKVTTFINYAASDDIVGGLRIGVPLTPSKDKVLNNALVVRGSQFWQYETRTTIRDPLVPGSNRLRPSQLFDPVLSHTLIKDYLNNGRYSIDQPVDNPATPTQRQFSHL